MYTRRTLGKFQGVVSNVFFALDWGKPIELSMVSSRNSALTINAIVWMGAWWQWESWTCYLVASAPSISCKLAVFVTSLSWQGKSLKDLLCSYHQDVKEWYFGKLSAVREIALAIEGGYKYYYMGEPESALSLSRSPTDRQASIFIRVSRCATRININRPIS